MSPKKQLIKFDFHVHTTRSDGKSLPEEVFKHARDAGLDMLAITDHNSSNHGFNPNEVFVKYGIRLVPGVELSFFHGHILVLGIDSLKMDQKLKEWELRRNTKKVRISTQKLKQILRWSVENGGLVIAAHPCIPSGFMSIKPRLLVELFNEGLIHGAEIHNDDIDRRIPTKLYNFWHRRVNNLLKKHQIPAYSNSDTHRIERLGNTYNIIEIEDPTRIIEVLRSKKISLQHEKQH